MNPEFIKQHLPPIALVATVLCALMAIYRHHESGFTDALVRPPVAIGTHHVGRGRGRTQFVSHGSESPATKRPGRLHATEPGAKWSSERKIPPSNEP